jgi:hypothetical protein
MTNRFTVAFCNSDEFNVVPGSGWVVLENGKRIDWPMMATREEAEAERLDFIREMRGLASDEASEARFYNR